MIKTCDRQKNRIVVLLAVMLLCNPLMVVGITIDGDPRDWVGIAPLLTDPLGNAPPGEPDFITLRVTNNSTFVYFLLEFANTIPIPTDAQLSTPAGILLDTDFNVNTGCPTFVGLPGGPVLGAEFFIHFLLIFGSIERSFLGDIRDCGTEDDDFPGALTAAISGRFIEAAVPISTLRLLTPTLTGFDVFVRSDNTQNVARYVFASFVVAFADITVKVEIKGDSFEVKSPFTLGATSDGIDPLTEAVSLQMGPFALTLPAGVFEPHQSGIFTFEGVVDDVALEVKITPLGSDTFEFKAEGRGGDLTGVGNPVAVILTIGDDSGTTTVFAEIE